MWGNKDALYTIKKKLNKSGQILKDSYTPDLDKNVLSHYYVIYQKFHREYNNAYLVMYKNNPYIRLKYTIAYKEILIFLFHLYIF